MKINNKSQIEKPFSDGCAFIDGNYTAIDEAKIPILDWGLIRSDATYDVVSSWKGKFFRLDAHLERFRNSLERLNLQLPISEKEMINILANCTYKAGLQDAYVEMICTRGQPKWGSRDPRKCQNAFYAFAVPYVWIATPEQQEEGLNLHISDKQRISPMSVDPTVKNYHWLDLDTALIDALETGHDTVLLTDSEGNLCEGPGFNIFIVNNNKISTPRYGVLEGITRKTVIDMAAELELELSECNVSKNQIEAADEVFISTTAGGVIAITKVDKKIVGTGKPGKITKLLSETYWSWHENAKYTTPILDLVS